MTSFRSLLPTGAPADQVRLLAELEALLPMLAKADPAYPAAAEKTLEELAPFGSPRIPVKQPYVSIQDVCLGGHRWNSARERLTV